MKITLKFLEEYDACEEGIECFKEHYTEIEHEELIADLIKIKQYDWIVWLISKLLTKIDNVKLSIFAAELCQSVFKEDEKDEVIKRCAETSKEAINAAKKYINEPTKENKLLCSTASDAAWEASYAVEAESYAETAVRYAVGAARYAAMAASYAETAAMYAARATGDVAWAARYAVWAASNAAGDTASDAAMAARYEKIIKYGIELIKKSEVSNEDNA
jgi:hypothetical protein